MLRLLSALLLVALASASGQPSFRLSIQVVNCSEADPHSWPWQAMVLYEEDGNLYFICGGTLIDPDWVMTAGHCFPYTGTYWVLLGTHDITNLGDKEQIIPGEKIIVHPDYDDNDVSKGNDIALIKLSRSAEVTEEVQPACLAPRDYILPNGTECYITGWGTTSTRGSVSNVLHQCLMKVVDYAHCSQPDWWGSTVKETMMCSCCDIAGCICDSGAPLVCRIGKGVWKVYGVASFVSANGCVTPQKPTVFTRVSAFIPWIIGVLNLRADLQTRPEPPLLGRPGPQERIWNPASASGQPSFRLSIRVVNGTEVEPHSWPWQAMVLYEEDGNLYFICGGTLIDPDWVMTAGHCFPYTGNYWVLLGAHNITAIGDKEQIIPGEEIIVHPDYDDNDASKGNDIALIKLSRSAEVTEEVQPACLAPRDYILPNGTECYITGWGTTSTGGSVSNVLLEGLLPVVVYENCSQPDWWGSAVKEIHVCAGGGNVAGCNGDSGGPLNCRIGKGVWKVYGVASFVSADGCDTPKKPTVFTRVSAFIPWICGTVCSNLKCLC